MRGDPPHLREHVQHQGTTTDDPLKLTSSQQTLVQAQSFVADLGFGQKAGNAVPKDSKVDRFSEVIASALLNRLYGRICRVVIRNQDYIHRRVRMNQTFKQVHPVGFWSS